MDVTTNTSDVDIDMYVTKRNGKSEIISYKKILERTKKLGNQFNLDLNYSSLVMKIMDQLYNNIKTSEIDELMSETCAALGSTNYDYYTLASALCISNHQKEVSDDFLSNYRKIYDNDKGYLSSKFLNIIEKHADFFRNILKNERDYDIDFFGFKTLERAYLMKHNNVIHERIQHMWLRVAIQIHGDDLEKVRETYDNLSQKYFIHATPTLFNSGTKRPQLSSCYLIGMEDDSIDGIFNTLHDCASISKWAGGIGLHIHNIRASGTPIVGTNGTSNGLVPMLRVFNNTARYVDQCVLPETHIYTPAGIKEIQHIQPGIDKIFNEKGGIEIVQNVLEHSYSGEMIEIKTKHIIEPLHITPEHPILCIQLNEPDVKYDVIKKRLENKVYHIEYCEVKHLNETSLIGYRIPSYFNDVSTLSEDDCFMYGLMIKFGYMNNTERKSSMTLNTEDDKNIIDFVRLYLTNKCIRFTENTKEIENKWFIALTWERGVDFPFHYSEFYDNYQEKRISERFMNLPCHKTKYIIKGLLYGNKYDEQKVIFNYSPNMILHQLHFLLLKMGVLCIPLFEGYCHYCSELRVPKTPEICRLLDISEPQESCVDFFQYGDYLFSHVTHVKKTRYDGVLYDLQMKEEHNYMLQQGIVHNGGGKRSGSFAMYLEPWHADVEDFLELRKNHGDEESRARDLFYAMWIPDLFMKKVEKDDYWYLMCPNECPNLSDTYGEDFDALYEKYVEENRYKKRIKARELWFQILDSQMETGTPYMLYKDSANKKSNQKNLGTIKSSNLCTEIIEFSNDKETAVCNLASISLSAMVDEKSQTFDFDKLQSITEMVTENLNKIIDANFYPTDKTHRSNMNHRPIGIGVQGLADAFAKMNLPFDSDEAQHLNRDIFETIYYGTMKKTNEIARKRYQIVSSIQHDLIYDLFKNIPNYLEWFVNVVEHNYYDPSFSYDFGTDKNVKDLINENYHNVKPTMQEILGIKFHKQFQQYIDKQRHVYGNKYTSYEPLPENIKQHLRHDQFCGAYSTFEGSPLSEGKFQFDLWDVEPSERYNWNDLRSDIMKYGVRNSLCVAPMPTASTSQILSNNECFEPFTSNIYTRRTLAGEFVVINKYLLKELKEAGIWNTQLKNKVIEQKGSIQNIEQIPAHIRNKYKIVWDMSMKRLIDMAKDRGAFICQSQSMNLWVEDPNYNNLTKMHFYSWRSGLKTGIYYLRRKAKHQAQQFTIEPTRNMSGNDIKSQANQEDDHEVCEMCSG
jgi:ribonucleotide reductase alpha subunit